ncbi:oxidation resistance protein 1-like isoform X2 [Xenia sp. Carnegie-2017]|uniref:oxidation resistance protein 1-like isoform X2 n=1 Tax=Xenia sp. Carnegie-2017 TaxID=2897299 RepID=UPI001F04B24D|nr:oxidation resistance protein 1-like isoform X2 [Xenia sp. Carnegie-2017]
MYGYLQARRAERVNCNNGKKREILIRSSVDLQSTGSISWESISYFFGRWWRNDLHTIDLTPDKKLNETLVDSDLIKKQTKLLHKDLLRKMENTIEYTVTAYDSLPKIALKFDVTPSELSRLNRLTIRTLYPGQILRVPSPKPAKASFECPMNEKTDASQIMTMQPTNDVMCKIPVAKRVSFEDIDEDVLETFIKIKSKYITDGQGVVKGFLLITPHAVMFLPDVSEILVVDRGIEYYNVHFTMQSVCSAGLFDDIASMVVHDELQPGHFFLDKPLMLWLGNEDIQPPKKVDEKESCITVKAPCDALQEKSLESISEITENILHQENENTTKDVSDQGDCSQKILIENDGCVSEDNADKDCCNLEDNLKEDLQQFFEESKCTGANKVDSEMGIIMEELQTNIVNRTDKQLSLETSMDSTTIISVDDVVLSSSEQSGLSKPKDDIETSKDYESATKIHQDDIETSKDYESATKIHQDDIETSKDYESPTKLHQDDIETSKDYESATKLHQINSTPKMPLFKDLAGDRGVDIGKEGFREGISLDSGIHESKEDVEEEDTNDQRCSSKSHVSIKPRASRHYENMPKYLCIRIKKSCWREIRPRCCLYAHEDIQRVTDVRREFWFSIPSERLLEVYSFFLEWCPAIHDGDTDDEEEEERNFERSIDSDYSVITMPRNDDDETFDVIENFYSNSPKNEHKQSDRENRKRAHSHEKRKKKISETSVTSRRSSSWSTCSTDEPVMPEIIGKSEILTNHQILQLSQCLPSRTIGHSWRLFYSTYLHGISLKTLYRTLADYDSPALLVILDDSHQVFGAFASSPFAVSDHFYGTGECFLYTFHPHFKAFRWSGENTFFIKGDLDSLALGGGKGNFGLWLDEDLYNGSSHRCKTFNNEPLTVKEEFLCCGVEIWCFQ